MNTWTNNTCRLCLEEGDEKRTLKIWESEIVDLPTKIMDCVSIQVSKEDNFPTTICLSCVKQITTWEKFRNNCHKTNNMLLKAAVENMKGADVTIYVVEQSLPNCRGNSKKKKRKILNGTSELDDSDSLKEEVDVDSDSSKKDVYIDGNTVKKEVYVDSDPDYPFKNYLMDVVYRCDVCSSEFDNCFQYLDHQETHDGDPVFQCDKCSEIFTLRKELVQHDKNHQTSCKFCGKLVLKSSMNLHLVKHTDKFRCSRCGGRFNSNAALSQHIITVHTAIKDHICEICGKRFSSQTAMRVHMKSHSDERMYPCKLCTYAGRTASAIYVHMSTHANDLCVCEFCSKTFKSTRNLNDHLRRVHSKEKKYQCSYCDKKFVDKYVLRIHVRCHTGVRPYQCTVCEKSFIRSDGLKEHMIVHGERVTQECKNCRKKFASKRGFARHNCVS
ncbi:hypothetical protein FQA39_LY18429 [Lamprigera yunnana]|nr:hypothetical protein FQA39_LY18429 [Lamprigera yunnana]